MDQRQWVVHFVKHVGRSDNASQVIDPSGRRNAVARRCVRFDIVRRCASAAEHRASRNAPVADPTHDASTTYRFASRWVVS